MSDRIATCTQSLSRLGRCCALDCITTATLACLFDTLDGLVECARCFQHAGSAVATKPLILADGLKAR